MIVLKVLRSATVSAGMYAAWWLAFVAAFFATYYPLMWVHYLGVLP